MHMRDIRTRAKNYRNVFFNVAWTLFCICVIQRTHHPKFRKKSEFHWRSCGGTKNSSLSLPRYFQSTDHEHEFRKKFRLLLAELWRDKEFPLFASIFSKYRDYYEHIYVNLPLRKHQIPFPKMYIIYMSQGINDKNTLFWSSKDYVEPRPGMRPTAQPYRHWEFRPTRKDAVGISVFRDRYLIDKDIHRK